MRTPPFLTAAGATVAAGGTAVATAGAGAAVAAGAGGTVGFGATAGTLVGAAAGAPGWHAATRPMPAARPAIPRNRRRLRDGMGMVRLPQALVLCGARIAGWCGIHFRCGEAAQRGHRGCTARGHRGPRHDCAVGPRQWSVPALPAALHRVAR